MKRIAFALLFVALATPVFAQLSVVTTSSTTVNAVFSLDGSVTVTDLVSPLHGGGFLQSRVFQAEMGSPAAGKWVYEYRISRDEASGVWEFANVLGLPFDGGVLQYDFDGDSDASDECYVVTSGGLGSKGLSAAYVPSGETRLHFFIDGQVDPGESSYFFGVVSDYPPRTVSAQVYEGHGSVMVDAYAPDTTP